MVCAHRRCIRRRRGWQMRVKSTRTAQNWHMRAKKSTNKTHGTYSVGDDDELGRSVVAINVERRVRLASIVYVAKLVSSVKTATAIAAATTAAAAAATITTTSTSTANAKRTTRYAQVVQPTRVACVAERASFGDKDKFSGSPLRYPVSAPLSARLRSSAQRRARPECSWW